VPSQGSYRTSDARGGEAYTGVGAKGLEEIRQLEGARYGDWGNTSATTPGGVPPAYRYMDE